MPKHDTADTLTTPQSNYITLRLAGYSATEAAKTLGVSERTIRRWHGLAHVQSALKTAQSEAIEDAALMSSGLVSESLKELADIGRSEEVTAATRVNAWRVVLDYSTKVIEQNTVMARLAEIEATNARLSTLLESRDNPA